MDEEGKQHIISPFNEWSIPGYPNPFIFHPDDKDSDTLCIQIVSENCKYNIFILIKESSWNRLIRLISLISSELTEYKIIYRNPSPDIETLIYNINEKGILISI